MTASQREDAQQGYERLISAERRGGPFNFKEVLRYRDLIILYARKSIVVTYKQTVLGPVWLWLTPLLTSLLQMLVFGYLAGFQTGDVPKIVFYLFSTTAWALFSGTVSSNAQIFTQNHRLFSKVHFARLSISYANMLSTVATVAFQFILSFCFMAWFVAHGAVHVRATVPLCILPMAMMLLLGQGIGLIFAALTVRYRDLKKLQPWVTRVLMYASPVVYPLSQLGSGRIATLLLLNPLCPAFELMRATIWGAPLPPAWSVALAVVVVVAVNLLGIMLFNRRERSYVDSI